MDVNDPFPVTKAISYVIGTRHQAESHMEDKHDHYLLMQKDGNKKQIF